MTRCVNGEPLGYSHDFDSPIASEGPSAGLMYCRKCGEVRRLVMPIEEASADERGLAAVRFGPEDDPALDHEPTEEPV